ncbi:porin family protein [Bacteroides fragilis]|nr:porin family protein [Bacteroides fragilis]MCS3290186.1 porin family protein [Bacteroides fragilis]
MDLYQAGPAFNHISFKMNYLELPLKLGYKFQLGDKLDLIPSIGIYGSYGFNAGNCSLDVYHSYENYGAYVPAQWKPFDGYYKVDDASSSSVSVIPLKELSHWDFGGVVGLKAVISNHFTASFNYSHSIRVIQRQMDLRNSNFQLSVGYLF